MSISDNLTHLIAAVAILAAGVALVIFAHAFVDVSYVLGTVFTLVGAILGFNFGSNSGTGAPPAAPAPAASPVVAKVPLSGESG